MPKIKFYNDVRANLELEKIVQDGKSALKITVPFNSYLVMGDSGWKEIELPSNIVFPNTTVISEDDLPNLLGILQIFIDTYDLPEESQQTKRGFNYLDFNNLSLQKSSTDGNFLWFGFSINKEDFKVDLGDGQLKRFEITYNEFVAPDRLHLSRANVSVLIQSIEAVMQDKALPDLTSSSVKYKELTSFKTPFKSGSEHAISAFIYFLLRGKNYYTGENHLYTKEEVENVFNNLLTYIFDENNPKIFFSLNASKSDSAYFEGVFSDDVFDLWRKAQLLDGKKISGDYFVDEFSGFNLYTGKASPKDLFLNKLESVTKNAPVFVE